MENRDSKSVFCAYCGWKIAENENFCTNCGNKKVTKNNDSGMGGEAVLPDELKGINYGAFFLTIPWSVVHKAYIGLLWLIPFFGIYVSIYLFYEGNNIAWKKRRFASYKSFLDIQKKWAVWGFWIFLTVILVLLIMLIVALIKDQA